MPKSEYQRGYDAAYAEIHEAIESQEHPKVCGGSCRACGVMRAYVEDLLINLGDLMTEEEFSTLAGILANVNVRLNNDSETSMNGSAPVA